MPKVNKMMVMIVSVCVIAVSAIYYNYKFVRYDSDKIIFGATYMTMNNSFYKAIMDEIEKQINDRGDILYTRDPALDVDKQNEQINDLMELGIDVLIINPVDYSKVNDSLKKAKEKGIKIIVIDAQLDDDTIADATVLSNNYDAGVQCAKDMMRNLASAKIVLLQHSAALSSVDRIDGFLDTIKNNDNYTVVANEECLGQTEVAMPVMMEIIDRKIDFDVVMALNDPSALGALAAIKDKQINHKVLVYGVDGSPDMKKLLIDSDEVQGTASQSPITMGAKAIEAAYQIVDDEEYEKSIVVPVALITKDNSSEFDVLGWQ
ncbi:ribose transport system substrate-binding protein [Trichococcus patagoniensis]|uniref:Ribose transport system substrate-binding protein n=1 Tax=Trichococcus patagoniensis TaxID=382641 RepID=A0A2T5INQ8_9LACT|nr:sugar ABC transporter substrate-binding protein [Trichococcus patagoniensis]PTQ85439.1 ribose transport system substrate-binding protein [Trichococcus patagoniensis]